MEVVEAGADVDVEVGELAELVDNVLEPDEPADLADVVEGAGTAPAMRASSTASPRKALRCLQVRFSMRID